HGQKPRRGGGDGGGSNPWSSSMPDFSITTGACPPAETARAGFGCGEGAGVGTAIARGGGGAGSDATPASTTCGRAVLRGLGVSSVCADFYFAFFFVFSDVFFGPDFFFAVFGFGVGDCFGFGVDAARVSVSSD